MSENQINVIFVGLGGIGSYLCEPICRFINYLPNRNDFKILLIDGDAYDKSNLTRQNFNYKNIGEYKSIVQQEKLISQYGQLNIDSCTYYINSDNISDYIGEKSIILSGVDNHKTRFVIQKYIENLSNVLLISGGNEYYDGDVQIYAKKDNIQLAPTIYQNYPGLRNPTDKSPDEIGCDELVESEPQLIVTNNTVALIMQWAFYNFHDIFYKDDIDIYKNDILFDIKDMIVVSKKRSIK